MNKIIISVFVLLMSYNSFGAEASVGRIVEIKGDGFISHNGKTKEIRKGDQLYPNSEIVVEHTGQVTFTDNADHRFHLGNSSTAAIGTNYIELRTGDVWFQSLNKTESYQIKTANALIDYQGGEAILSYDVTKSKTQLMVINGMMKLSNLRTPELNLSVAEGNFSFVDSHYEEGMPRDPTPVGEKTYKQLIGTFKGVMPLDKKSEVVFKHEEVKREIASVHNEIQEEKQTTPKQTTDLDVYKEKLLQAPALAVKKPVRKKHPMVKAKEEALIVHIYGQKVATPKESARMPASVKEEVAPTVAPQQNYKETDKLIQALKNL